MFCLFRRGLQEILLRVLVGTYNFKAWTVFHIIKYLGPAKVIASARFRTYLRQLTVTSLAKIKLSDPLADPGGGGHRGHGLPQTPNSRGQTMFWPPQTGQWVYLVSTESTDFTGFVT